MASAEKFRSLVEHDDCLTLIREWQDVIFHTVFVKKRGGLELPMLLPIEDRVAFLGSPNPKQVRANLSQYEIPEDADVFIKPVLLKELARNAFLLESWLAWVGESIVMNDSLMAILGMNAICRNGRGVESLYESQVLNLQGEEAGKALVPAQRWLISELNNNAASQEPAVRLVFDDSAGYVLLGSDGRVLDGSRALSKRTPEEQVLFRWWSQPVYDFAGFADMSEDDNDPVLEDTYIPQNAVVSNDMLDSFFDLERAVHNQLVGDSDSLHLEVREAQTISDAQGDSEIDWVEARSYHIVFDDHPEWLLPLGGSGLALEDFSEGVKLPRDIGRYPVPSEFRIRLVRHITSVLFWMGKDPANSAASVPGQFWTLIPFYPDNLKRMFIPDWRDHRFPMLASLTCGSDKVSVLIHGEVPEGYVCEPLDEIRVPASDLPAGISGRDSLVINGAVHFPSMCSSLVVPATGIEFPSEWYMGARTSNTQLISDFSTFLGIRALERHRKDAKRMSKSPHRELTKVGIVVLASSFVAVLLMVLIGLVN